MDSQLRSPIPPEGRDVVRGGMPFERPLEMPVQDLRRAPDAQPMEAAPTRTILARALTILGTLAIAGYGVFEMLGIVSFASMTVLQGVMILFFALTLVWIAFAAASTVTGFFIPPPRGDPDTPIAGSRTALVMPVYNEDPARTTAGVAGDGGSSRTARGGAALRDRRHLGLDERRRLDQRIARRRRAAADAARGHSCVVPAALAQHRTQGGQRRGVRQALGRPLRLHGRARRRQPDVGVDARRTGAPHAGGFAARHSADCADADRTWQRLRARSAVRWSRVRRADRSRRGGVVRQRRQLLGPQRDHSRQRVRCRPAACRNCRAASRSAAMFCRTTSSKRR